MFDQASGCMPAPSADALPMELQKVAQIAIATFDLFAIPSTCVCAIETALPWASGETQPPRSLLLRML